MDIGVISDGIMDYGEIFGIMFVFYQFMEMESTNARLCDSTR